MEQSDWDESHSQQISSIHLMKCKIFDLGKHSNCIKVIHLSSAGTCELKQNSIMFNLILSEVSEEQLITGNPCRLNI